MVVAIRAKASEVKRTMLKVVPGVGEVVLEGEVEAGGPGEGEDSGTHQEMRTLATMMLKETLGMVGTPRDLVAEAGAEGDLGPDEVEDLGTPIQGLMTTMKEDSEVTLEGEGAGVGEGAAAEASVKIRPRKVEMAEKMQVPK
ncbi:hypothetical protein ANANG_G00261080 [Anguilla anguilla]|uniref:Uncharacterized protein n=1 Tax=Anguilla anguilla TaxID=7936 RepID=A0A9D3LQC0_ANGAN|nr:hypothetical protein ANANG_G00261080 [Anguilla anguilla]